MTLTEISKIQYDKNMLPSYSRVGDEGWVDGLTPLSAENLNKSDVALFNLLNASYGYVYQLIDKLNNEISIRLSDDKQLKAYIDEEIQKLCDDLISALGRQVVALNDAINNVDSAQSAKYAELTNTVEQNYEEVTEAYATLNGKLSSEITRAKKEEANIRSNIPTSVSQLKNDSGYLTEHQSLDDYVTIHDLEAKNYVDSKTFNKQAVKEEDNLIFNCGSSSTNMFN